MSGGGNDGQPQNPVTPVPAPNIGGATGTKTMQPFMPGFDQQIANQMGQGFGGKPEEYLAAFQKIFSPMTIPTYGGTIDNKPWKEGEFVDTRVPGDNGRRPVVSPINPPRTGGNTGAGRTGGRNS